MDIGFGLGELRFLLLGLQWTVLLSLIAFAGGGLAGLARISHTHYDGCSIARISIAASN